MSILRVKSYSNSNSGWIRRKSCSEVMDGDHMVTLKHGGTSVNSIHQNNWRFHVMYNIQSHPQSVVNISQFWGSKITLTLILDDRHVPFHLMMMTYVCGVLCDDKHTHTYIYTYTCTHTHIFTLDTSHFMCVSLMIESKINEPHVLVVI